MFGENFFSDYLPNKKTFPDLREFTKLKLEEVMAEKHDAFLADLPGIFSISYPFLLSDPMVSPYIMMKNNITQFARAIEDHFIRSVAARGK